MPPHFQQKLIVPVATHTLIVRPKLYERLEAAITTRQLVALAAPAGWGKTTVLAQWAAATALPVAWYTLDRTDHDLQLFVSYLLHAVAPYVPGCMDMLRQLGETPPQAMIELLQQVAATIAQAPNSFALVLDDAHILEEETAAQPSFNMIFELLGTITEYAPNCHLVLASRTLPTRQGLARMVVQQRAAIFDYTTLQFQPEEVRQLALLAGGVGIETSQAERLTAQLDGWIAGISLALDHMAHHDYDPFSEHALDLPLVYEYFAEQVSAPLPALLLRFLEDTSVLESLSPQRCDQLLGAGISRPYLDALQHHALFFSRRGNWISLHSLFRDFLRSRLARDPARAHEMQRRAGDLYRAEDDLERATDAYLAAGAVEEATALLRSAAPRYLQHARQLTLQICFERLTDAYRQADRSALLPADLLLTQARVFSDLAQWQHAELAVQLAERSENVQIRHEARIMAADIHILQHDTDQAQRILSSIVSETLPASLQFTFQITVGRLAMMTNQLDTAIEAFEQAQTLAAGTATSTSDLGTMATIADNLGFVYALRGDNIAATAALRHADACWQASGNQGRRSMTLNNLGVLVMEEGHYTEARITLETGRQLAQQTGRRREEIYLLASMADLSILEGQFVQALAQFNQAWQIVMQVRAEALEATIAVGALWAATMQYDNAAIHHWLPIVSALKQSQRHETRGRLALAEGLLLVAGIQSGNQTLVELVREAEMLVTVLSLPERAALQLLHGHLALQTGGWAAAAGIWATFETMAAQLEDAVVAGLIRYHTTLALAAAPVSMLAQRYSMSTSQNAMFRWSVTALGSFHFTVDGIPCALSSLHRAILVRLLDAGAQGVSIERLWQDVWGDDDVSMPALHTALSRLRSQTKLLVVARDGVCAIQSPRAKIHYDVWNLEGILDAPLSAETARLAMAVYSGDFLPGEVPSATLWADSRRAQLQQRYLDTLERTGQLVAHNAPEEALHYYQHVLQIDPCREQTAAQVMRLAARCGKRSLVTTTFDRLNIALRSLGTSPDPELAELYSILSRPTQARTAVV